MPSTYGPNNNGLCADVDTCDQAYNPTCAINSLNYPANPAITDKLYTRRAATCTANGPGYCSPTELWCCSVRQVACSKNAEVVAYYDGTGPSFDLIDEGAPADGGIRLTYLGAQAYIDDPFPCAGNTDPGTGLAPVRALSIVIGCNRSVDTISNATFYETGPDGSPTPCRYTIYTTSKYACGVMRPSCNSTAPIAPPAAAAAASSAPGAAGAVAGGFFGGALAAGLATFAVMRFCSGGGGSAGYPASGANPFQSGKAEHVPLMMRAT